MLTNLRVGAHERTSDLRVLGLTASNFQALCLCSWWICVLRAEIWRRWRLTSVLSKVPQIQNHKYLVFLLQKFPPRLSVNITADSISLATNPLIFFLHLSVICLVVEKPQTSHPKHKPKDKTKKSSKISHFKPKNSKCWNAFPLKFLKWCLVFSKFRRSSFSIFISIGLLRES